MIDEDEKKMIGRKYEQIGGLTSEEFGIGDIAVITKYWKLVSFGSEKYSKIRLRYLCGFEEWKEVVELED